MLLIVYALPFSLVSLATVGSPLLYFIQTAATVSVPSLFLAASIVIMLILRSSRFYM